MKMKLIDGMNVIKQNLAVISWISLSINNEQPELNIYFTKIDPEHEFITFNE